MPPGAPTAPQPEMCFPPRTDGTDGYRQREVARIRNEQLASFLTDSLRTEIRRLTAGRRSDLGRAREHRRHGQLIPASLCQDMAENDGRLRRALARYEALTGRRA